MTDQPDDYLPDLRRLGPDVGETEPTVPYVDPDLERAVMDAITRYPTSGVNQDGTVHGLAAVAAIRTVEQWLLARDGIDEARVRAQIANDIEAILDTSPIPPDDRARSLVARAARIARGDS